MKTGFLFSFLLLSATISLAQTGNVGIGNSSPTNRLHVTATADPARLEGLQPSTSSADRIIVATPTGVLKLGNGTPTTTLSIATTGVASIPRAAAGTATNIPNDYIVENTVAGASYDVGTNLATIPPGTYLIVVAYEGNFANGAVDDANNFANNSYYYDFRTSTGGTRRIHSNSPSNWGVVSNHAATMTYVAKYTTPQTFSYSIGWGQGGNVAVGHPIQLGQGSQLSFIRISD